MDEFDLKHKFLVENVYLNLTNLNTGFDSPYIFYFKEADFEVVLNRIEKYGILLSGIEPWLKGQYYDVQVKEDYLDNGDKWYRQIFEDFKNKAKSESIELQYAASYHVSEEILNV